jgi:hypothetical protein
MSSDDLLILGFFGLIGMFGIVIGTTIWTGYFKSWFIIERVPVIVPTAFYNGSMVFLGLTLISVGLAALADRPGLYLFFGLSLPLMTLTIILAIWQPRWIQPSWYRWLEENHEEIIPILQEEVRQMGPREWQRQVSTQEGLEQWVEEVRRKRGLG